jgi:hypothetical protein
MLNVKGVKDVRSVTKNCGGRKVGIPLIFDLM